MSVTKFGCIDPMHNVDDNKDATRIRQLLDHTSTSPREDSTAHLGRG